jgi:NAD(P)-dependent dehydrogenase (short-subunit alcohol dehydrogenase family)
VTQDEPAQQPNIQWNFSGQTVLITGGTTGIGRAAALRFLQAGSEVWVAGLADDHFRCAEQDPELQGARLVACDVSSDDDVRALFSQIDRLNAVVHCAGMILRTEEFEIATFTKVVDVNLNGAMRIATAARPFFLREGGGAIVNIASMLSTFGGPRVPAYSASKGGIVQLSKSLAVAWAPENIRVNAIAPGWIATNLTMQLQQNPEASEKILSRTPMGRWGSPEDVADAIVFLCSSGARFITGTVLAVDGGYSSC